MEYTRVTYARVVGDMPPFYDLPYAIWGKGCSFDSDGDADHRDSENWRELDTSLRPALKNESAFIIQQKTKFDFRHFAVLKKVKVELSALAHWPLNRPCRF